MGVALHFEGNSGITRISRFGMAGEGRIGRRFNLDEGI